MNNYFQNQSFSDKLKTTRNNSNSFDIIKKFDPEQLDCIYFMYFLS